MIAAWMAYAFVISGIWAIAAVVAERALRTWRRPVRWVWTSQFVAALTIPLWALVPVGASTDGGSGAASTVPVLLEPLRVTPGAESIVHVFDTPLLVLWVTLSTLLLVRTALGAYQLLRLRAGWGIEHLDGSPVRVSRDTGPAVTGVLKPEIVVPSWLTRVPGRELVVAHEREHVRGWDSRILAAARLAVSLAPWNPVLWWSLHRLRLAMELDCDRRVLRAFPERLREYCELLVSVGETRAVPPGAPALSEPRTLLERRIDAMTRQTRPTSLPRTVVLAALASGAVGFACFYPSPDDGGFTDPLAVAMDAADLNSELTDEPTFTPFTVRPYLQNTDDVQAALEAEYPPLLRDAGIGGTVNIWFLIDTRGEARETRVQKTSGHAALDDAALRVAETMRFSPALNHDEPVPVWVAFPITFTTN